MREVYCPVCQTITMAESVTKKEIYMVRGADITIDATVLTCKTCQTDIFDPDIDAANLAQAYQIYCAKNEVISAEDIKGLRDRYAMSQRTLAKLLNWSPATIYRYEKGNIPTPAHNDCLKRLFDPMEFDKLVQSKEYVLTENEKQNLLMGNRESCNSTEKYIERVLLELPPCEENGYKRLDLKKLINMMTFFTQKGISKTVLMKHLWLADFTHYKEYGTPISGAVYAALPNGPALDNWYLILQLAVNEQMISLEPIYYNEVEGELVKANKSYQPEIFTTSEMDTLEKVAKKLNGKTARQLSNLSHDEDAYKLTQKNKLISYEHAFSLQMAP
ncbi:MAG: DUF4065 domain-containing protein [Syntrophomonadaceae bacterium]|nr:DUF4065 domain-containing protein [Syntrophomonadaceae bacterium]MDD3888660.1 DUF4065 domain-containing protein [Syntrophomonadaceae bacterium]MDD4548525.1 DUF4065 domain-containing protein [Syntrophomonadaceae bacterium]